MFRIICFDYKICSVDYFMDELQEWEMNTMIKNIPYLDRNEKEMDRYKLFVTVQANSKKKIKLNELVELPWDKEFKNTGTKLSEDEAREYKEKASEFEERIKAIGQFEAVDLAQMMKKK